MGVSLLPGTKASGTVLVRAPTPDRRLLAFVWFLVFLGAFSVMVTLFAAVAILPGAALLAGALVELRAN